MGLFERISRMVDDGLIKPRTPQTFAGYRVANILSNQRVVQEKFVKRGSGWTEFLHLARRMGYDVPSPLGADQAEAGQTSRASRT